MQDYLLFTLYSPLAAWGDIAVGEYRPSFAHPGKSAIVGLIAAAMGIRRDEEERQQSLAESFAFAVRVDAIGVLLRDYQTTQVPPSRKGVTHYTRRSELTTGNLNTILSSRDYRCDAFYTVAITLTKSSPYNIQQFAEALTRPDFTPYLGRKSCPPALPFAPHIVKTSTLREAFEKSPVAKELASIRPEGPTMVYWEDDVASGLKRQQVIIRRDAPVSRKRWQFRERRENFGTF